MRVLFEYRTASVADRIVQPVEVRVDGSKIFVIVTHQDSDPRWQMLIVSPTGMPAVNLLGVAMVLAQPYIEKVPRWKYNLSQSYSGIIVHF